ncbi:MAG TPA: Plug domain-containing protein, partial [Longimicrobiales bacterium]|nr:Plug domain-containing protein [Longimicrobiales bacterium]
VAIQPGARVTVSIRLATAAAVLEGVTASVERQTGIAIRELGRQRITPRQIRMVPVPGGSGDLASFLQTLPGVVTTGDRGGQLFIRGGSPAENLVLIDGIPIFQPFHILGYYSAFPEQLVRSVDFYAGGFGARYNGRTSSVLDVHMRDGTPAGFTASSSLSPYLAEVLTEGPLGSATWIFSARRSLIEETSETLLGTTHPITFDNQFLKVSYSEQENMRCSALMMRTSDRGRLDPLETVSHVGWKNFVLGGRCVALLSDLLRLVEVNFSLSSVENAAISRGSSRFISKLTRVQHDAHMTNLIGSVPIYAGYHLYADLLDLDLTELFDITRGEDEILGMGVYGEASIKAGPWVELRPGVVASVWPNPSLEPRLRASWQPFADRPDDLLQAAVGYYRQELIGLTDMRDVGFVFTSWMRSRRFWHNDETLALESVHGILGWQQSIGDRFSYSVEGWVKRIDNVPVPRWSAEAWFQTDLIPANGPAYGADIRAEYVTPVFYGMLGYGYGWLEFEAAHNDFGIWFGEPVQRFHPPHDRRHQLNVVGSLDFAGFTASLRWQLGSGLPFSRPLGFDENFDFSWDLHDVAANLGTPRVVLDRPFTARMPVMHRLDLSIGRGIDMPLGRLELQAGAINVYDRPNMFYYDLFTGGRVDQLPIAPYAAVSLRDAF